MLIYLSIAIFVINPCENFLNLIWLPSSKTPESPRSPQGIVNVAVDDESDLVVKYLRCLQPWLYQSHRK